MCTAGLDEDAGSLRSKELEIYYIQINMRQNDGVSYLIDGGHHQLDITAKSKLPHSRLGAFWLVLELLHKLWLPAFMQSHYNYLDASYYQVMSEGTSSHT
jgi:hypothetical protein